MRVNNTNAPDFLRFKQLLQSVFSSVVEPGDDRSSWRYIAPGANPDADYGRVSNYLVSKYYEIESQIHDEQVLLLCVDDVPRFRDSRLRETFDAFVDLNFEIYAEHLPIARREFDGDDTFDLDAAISAYPGTFSVTVVETTGSVDHLFEWAMRFCTEPFTMNFITDKDVITVEDVE